MTDPNNSSQKDEYYDFIIDEDNSTTILHRMCQKEEYYENNTIQNFIQIGGKDLLLQKDIYGRTALSYAVESNSTRNNNQTTKHNHYASIEAISKMVDVGGKDLLMITDYANKSVLHYAFETGGGGGGGASAGGLSIGTAAAVAFEELISIFVNVGGKDFVLLEIDHGEIAEIMPDEGYVEKQTALHLACTQRASLNIIETLVGVGGKELVMKTTQNDETALHFALGSYTTLEEILYLIDVGGKDLVTKVTYDGQSALHVAFQNKCSHELIEKLILVGGKEIVMGYGTNLTTVLHYAFIFCASLESISLLIDVGGRELIMEEDYLLLCLSQSQMSNEEKIERLYIIFETIIKAFEDEEENSDEFDIGFLFKRQSAVDSDYWQFILAPTFRRIFETYRNVPMLQAIFIHAESVSSVLVRISNNYDFINVITDSFGRYPLDVGIELKHPWDCGLREVCERFALIQNKHIVFVAARHGLKWENGFGKIMKYDSSASDTLIHKDEVTGLFPFMLSASGERSDLDSIYNLLKIHPQVVK